MTPSEWAQNHAREQIELIRQLCLIPAFSGQEEQRAAFISAWLKNCGAENVFIDAAGNVCLPFGDVTAKGLRVYIAHMDTVFPMDTPLIFKEEGGRLLAPGVGDDTANVAALMLLAREWIADRVQPPCPVLIAFNTGEEGLGNLRGVRELCRVYGGHMAQLITFDGTYRRVVDKAVGSTRYRVTVRTEGGHSYGAFGHANAIHQAAEIISALYQMQPPQKENTKTTYNVGTVTGGTSVNTIAQDAAFTCEFRSDDRESLGIMRERFESLFSLYRSYGWEVDVQVIGERPCMGQVDEAAQEALLNSCSDVIEQVCGTRPERGSSSTDANIPLSLGIPATSFGLYRGGQSHTREEWLETATLVTGLEIGYRILRQSL